MKAKALEDQAESLKKEMDKVVNTLEVIHIKELIDITGKE